MNRITGWLLAIILLAVAAAGYYFWRQGANPPEAPPATAVEAPPPAASPQPEAPTHYPIPENPAASADDNALPALDQSDGAVWDALTGLFGKAPLADLLRPQEIVRRIVVTIDNLPRQTLATRLLPTKPVGGGFVVSGPQEALAIAPENAARYTPYVRLAEAVDAGQLVALYVRFYPLFQSAYRDLGYPDGYFNDRLVAVIDHLLATPEPAAPPRLVQPHVLYRFADPELEAQSAGRKILLRMGSENAARIKARLRQIRAQLTSGGPQAPR